MQQDLDPLLPLMIKPKLTEEEVHECKKVIYKLQAMEHRSDSLPVPMITIRGKASRKEEQYKQLWSEMDLFLGGASTTSNMHRKVLDCLRGTPDDVNNEAHAKAKVETVEEKSWKELDRYQTMTETEKKSFNNRQPSDPRRRRRSSGDTNSLTNSLTSSLKVDETPTVSPTKHKPKSPASDSDSPVKKRHKKSSSLSLTPTIQPKSSLLSIWTNHMSLSASRLHEEFE